MICAVHLHAPDRPGAYGPDVHDVPPPGAQPVAESACALAQTSGIGGNEQVGAR